MELEQAKKRVEELRAVIEKNNRLYYDQDAPELEDFEYDALTRELKELEAQFPQLVTASSPTQKVGGTASSKLPKVTHAVKMESLLDAFSYDELRDFDRRVREAGIEGLGCMSGWVLESGGRFGRREITARIRRFAVVEFMDRKLLPGSADEVVRFGRQIGVTKSHQTRSLRSRGVERSHQWVALNAVMQIQEAAAFGDGWQSVSDALLQLGA